MRKAVKVCSGYIIKGNFARSWQIRQGDKWVGVWDFVTAKVVRLKQLFGLLLAV